MLIGYILFTGGILSAYLVVLVAKSSDAVDCSCAIWPGFLSPDCRPLLVKHGEKVFFPLNIMGNFFSPLCFCLARISFASSPAWQWPHASCWSAAKRRGQFPRLCLLTPTVNGPKSYECNTVNPELLGQARLRRTLADATPKPQTQIPAPPSQRKQKAPPKPYTQSV